MQYSMINFLDYRPQMVLIVRGFIGITRQALEDAYTYVETACPTCCLRQASTRGAAVAWPQEQLAHEAGLDRSYVGQVERGERNITLDNIHRLAEALRLVPATLF